MDPHPAVSLLSSFWSSGSTFWSANDGIEGFAGQVLVVVEVQHSRGHTLGIAGAERFHEDRVRVLAPVSGA